MKRIFTQNFVGYNSLCHSIRAVLVIIMIFMSASVSHAQLGNGWKAYSPTKKIHLDNVDGLQTFNWTAYKSVCTPDICSDYSYNSTLDTETFRILDSRSNRSEIRLQNEYSTGSRQFEGYVTFNAPLNDESLMQIFGSTSGATQMMLRGYAADGGSIRGAGKTVATNVYGREVRVNVIHLQEDVGNKIQIYIDGVKMAEIADNEAVTNYHKYGNYGTMRTGEAVVKWRQARFFRDGLSPDQNAFVTINSPASGSQFIAPANITISATAADANSEITKVEFFNGSTKIGEDSSSPYSLDWNNVTVGSYSITAKSTNASNEVVTSSAVTINVNSPPSPQTPYLGIQRNIPGKIEAEDYDEGGQGVAYNDLTAGNNYKVYRFDRVDIQPCGDAGGGFNVALVATGEWVEYTVNVLTSGTYKLDLRLAATTSTRALHVEMDGVNITGKVSVPNTGNFQVYKTVTITTPVITAGLKVMRVFFETPSHNLNWLNFTVDRRTQTITLGDIEDLTYGYLPFEVIASSDSELPVTLEVVSGPAVLDGGFLTVTGAGDITIRASQAGDQNYLPAAPVEKTFTVHKAPQNITFDPIETKTYGDAPFELSAEVDSGLPLTFELLSGPATISASTITITGAGEVTVRVSQSGNENYLPASVEQTFTVNKAEQTITFGDITPKHISEVIDLFATSSSGLPVSFEVISGPGVLTDNVLSFSNQGEVIIRANQLGNENYLAAAPVDQSVLAFADDAKKDGLLLIVNPNPTKGKVMVKMDNKKDKEYSFVVYDKYGQVIESSVIAKSHKMFEINLDREQNGVYYLWVTDGTDIWVRKIIKE